MSEGKIAKHSPAPWQIGMPSGHNADGVYANNGEDCVAKVYNLFSNTKLEDMLTYESRKDIAEGLANARLIAAAPELLEALEVLLHEYALQMEDEEMKGDPDLDFDQFTEVIQARAAIAKATGS